MPAPLEHKPVLSRQVVELLEPQRCRRIIDCTVGLGGHAAALLEKADPSCRLIAIDRDERNLRLAKERLSGFQDPAGDRVRFFHAGFADIQEVLHQAGIDKADAVLADLGVSSSQIDDPQRGFSFVSDGPLDMRMDPTGDAPTAAKLVNTLSEDALADLLFDNADERRSRQIARHIVRARQVQPITRTLQLVEIVRNACKRHMRARINPATRTFQALRMAVNAEREQLAALLAAMPRILEPGARVAVISFHSLEDGPVKFAFSSWKSAGCGRIITRKPVVPDDEEVAANPRSRSAKLRCFEWAGRIQTQA
jgi:16S rRNA (cytosine1402-N4)-methyltransferase